MGLKQNPKHAGSGVFDLKLSYTDYEIFTAVP